jgi:Novel STAND NTPase 1/Stimulus-sensing domain/TIR domain/Sensor N-terminal transmembrane domain
MRVFLSYHSPDASIALSLKQAIEARDSGLKIFFAPQSLSAGDLWLPSLAEAMRDADAVLLLVGNSLGAWQKLEYYEALDRRAREPSFPVVPVITGKAPGLPFLRQLQWVISSVPHQDPQLTAIIGALKGDPIAETEKPWRIVNPYRGLLSLREDDAAYFFGRAAETADVLKSIQHWKGKLIALIGNSGVGKSSLVQAGIIGSLKRRRWPGEDGTASTVAWPTELKASRSWAYLTMKPGENPIRSLAYAFTDLWFQGHGDPKRHDWVDGWESRLATRGRLSELLDDTESRYIDVNLPPPPRVLLYVDQAEELYASRLPRQLMDRFSEIIALSLNDPRLLVLASQRSDYYGHLQANAALFPSTLRVDVPPLGTKALGAVLSNPARSLGASFESDGLVTLLVDAAKDQPGALPLLADHMSELWSRMQARGDGVLRIADRSEIIQVSSTLVSRADRFLKEHATSLDTIKRLFCLQLAHVPREGEPVRRRALRSNCTDAEWLLIERMSAAEWRLLVTGEIDGVAQAEIAHEVLLREWPTLREWLLQEREFLAWRGEMEHARREAELVPNRNRRGALLMGRSLGQAEYWLSLRSHDIGDLERIYIEESTRNRNEQRRSLRLLTALIMFLVVIQPLGTLYFSQFLPLLIDSRKESLQVQGEIIAGAIAASARVETDTITIDPEHLFELQAGESAGEEALSGLEFPINPERVAPLLRRLLAPTSTRARIYDRDGLLVLDSRALYDVRRFDLPPPGPGQQLGLLEQAYRAMRVWLSSLTLPIYREFGPENGKGYQEVAMALQGLKSSMVRANERGEVIVSVAWPVRSFRSVRGALMLSTQGASIDDMVDKERLNVAMIFCSHCLQGW